MAAVIGAIALAALAYSHRLDDFGDPSIYFLEIGGNQLAHDGRALVLPGFLAHLLWSLWRTACPTDPTVSWWRHLRWDPAPSTPAPTTWSFATPGRLAVASVVAALPRPVRVQ